MRARRYAFFLTLSAATGIGLHSSAAQAKLPQSTAGNPPPSIQPQPTNTGHEIGAGFHFYDNPDVFMPKFRYRYIFASTAAQGPLSGFWLEANIGPGVGYGGGILGNTGLFLGYEFDPWSNLALTFSPVLHNDFFFDEGFFRFGQTVGAIARLYVSGNWVFYAEPASFGWSAGSGGGVWFAFQATLGFGYKF